MKLSGEDIRNAAKQHESTCPEAMKNSFYYGFREGAKWAIKMCLTNKNIDKDGNNKTTARVHLPNEEKNS